MGSELRDRDPAYYRLITIRTESARLWMRPSENVNKILGGILARYTEICGIELYSHIFLSNHLHLIIRAPEQNTDEFMENLDREIARRMNWKNHRTGNFWGKRYADQKIIREEDLLEAFLYVNTNAVKHGLVNSADKWPGLCSYSQCISGKVKSFSFYHHSAGKDDLKVTRHKLKIKPLPNFVHLSAPERGLEVERLIKERTEMLVEERIRQGGGFLGASRILAQDPGSTPFETSSSPRPACYSKSAAFIKEFKILERERREVYAEASMRYRLGDLEAEFPLYTFKPPLHRKPRLFPFQPLPDDYFKKSA